MTDPEKVETVTLGGLRYVVATLREEDLERIAQKVARLMRDEDERVAARTLAGDHARGPAHLGQHPDCVVCLPLRAIEHHPV